MVEKAESPYVRVFAFCFLFGRTNIETSQLFFRDVIKFASFSRYQGAVSARGFGHVSADPEASRTQKKPLIPKVPVKKTNAEYLNYYPIAMLVFFRSSLVSSISRLSDK